MFGSTDNAAALKNLEKTQGYEGVGGTRTLRTGQPQPSQKHDDDDCCVTGGAGAPSSSDNTPDHTRASGFDAILHEVQELQENQGRLEDCFENLKSYHQREYTVNVQILQEEQYRWERLEEQFNDLTEMHQNEIFNLKEELAGMEEKIAHHSNDIATDIYEVLEACQTRLFKMEQQQQAGQVEGLESGTARTLFGKLINVLLLAVMAVVVFVSTCVVLFMKTRSCMLYTLLLVVVVFWRQWDAVSEYLYYFICTHPEKGDQ
ncbi:transmembrane and coiled-coil domains protein 1-like [Morone saxatilis]|uniref:transmembrane and coiled-coil domains protein 1-like n=1 Tax=Morone saxatilis TaxID=34816 RepID=UPI0015E23E48|nr:transmembrane and coiled-coil domains protein 1-like [Morone saxatilis]